ncbi:MAG: UvrD-helicase domain-containing protein, partial [Pseudomonadota bacterium]
GGGGWTIDAAARARLIEARHSFDQATIATIHAFCQRILTDEPLSTGRLIGQTQVDGQQAFGETFRDVLRRTLATDSAHKSYLDAYLNAGGRADSLETLLYRAATARGTWASVYDEGRLVAAAERLAALNLDAIDVENALRRFLHHSSVSAMLRRLRRLKLQAQESLTNLSWGRLLACLDAEVDVFQYFETLAVLPTVPPPVEPFRHLSRMLLDPAPSLEEAVVQRFLPVVVAELRRRKLTDGLYDFDDMIRAVDEALDGDQGAALAEKLRDRFLFALVDEAQDIEPAQWNIFRRVFLLGDVPRPLILIGDPKQAIYGFRGADVHTYVAARDEIIGARGGVLVPLARNHRSHGEVVDAYNAVLDHQAAPRYFSTDAVAYDRPVVAAKPRLGDGPGATLLRIEPPAGTTAPARIGTIRRALLEAIVRQLETLRAAPPAARTPLSEIYVLTRSNVEAREVAARLHAAGIANVLYRPDYIFRSNEATHVRALLLAIADPGDRARRLGAWLTPFFDISLTALAAGGADPPPDHPLVARLIGWKTLADAHAYDVLWSRIVDDSGIARRLRLAPSGLRALTNYRHVFDLLHDEAAVRPTSVEDLATLLAAGLRRPTVSEDDTQRLETEADAVRIMTTHAAKGLEADIVFVYGGFTGRRFWKGVHTLQQDRTRQLCVGKPKRPRLIELIDATRHEEEQR